MVSNLEGLTMNLAMQVLLVARAVGDVRRLE